MSAIEVGPVIIGAGAIGLAIAAELSQHHSDVIVLEAESSFGQHTSSRNSEVIHSGIYYEPGSLKSTLCLSGKEQLYAYLKKYDIAFQKCGKLIVAAADEQAELSRLVSLAQNLGLSFEELDGRGLRKRCAIVKAESGIFLSDTGFFDSHGFMQTLVNQTKTAGGHIQYNAKVISIEVDEKILIRLEDRTEILTNTLINSAGLHSDKIARMTGERAELKYYKGEYYVTDMISNLPHLVYSVPPADRLSLGIHTRHYLDGRIGFGPNAYPILDIDYSLNEDRKSEFIRDIQKYLDVDLRADSIWPDYAGIRPKISAGSISTDFDIRYRETASSQVVNLLGIESPGLTCALSIAGYVAGLLK